MTIAALSSGSEETAPRKNAENTVKHHDGGVGSAVANHRGGGKKFGDHNNTKCNHQIDGCIVWNAHNTIFSSRHACRHVTKNSTAWQPTTARLLAMVINNSTAFTLQSYSEASNIGKKCNSRRTSQKIWGPILYEVYRPSKWLWTDSNGKNGN